MGSQYKGVRLVIADLDGTLNISKMPIDREMAELISELLKHRAFAVISGGSYEQFQKQFVANFNDKPELTSRLYLFPTCATSMYVMKNGNWEAMYQEVLSEKEKSGIFKAFELALADYGFKKPEKMYGELIEDRETQITFSAYGQKAPPEVKALWDPDKSKRNEIISFLYKYLPEGFEAKTGGMTSIDITKKGIDKAYGIRKIEEKLNFKTSEMLFLGDDLGPNGNDYPVKTTGVRCIEVNDPEQTKAILKQIIQNH